MKFIVMVVLLLSIGSVYAGQCKSAYKKAKELEQVVKGVYYITESDSTWDAFASWVPVKDETDKEIRKTLKLGALYEGRESFFSIRGASGAYSLIEQQIENFGPDVYDEPESLEKFKKLLNILSEKYGDNIQFIQFGNGDGDAYFVGDQMILIIDESGCLFGLKAFTVWT